MKKNLLSVLMLTGLGLTAVSHAATTQGNYSGTQTFNGEITVPTAQNQWEWATGSDITLDGKTSELTANGTTFTRAATADTLLLAGQTKAVSIGSTTVSLRPKVELKNADDTAVSIDFTGATGNSGKGVIKLKVMPETGSTALGEMTLNVKAAGVGFSGQTTNSSPVVKTVPLLSSTSNTSAILKGVVPDTAAAAMSTSAAETWLTALGVTQNAAGLLADYNQKLGTTRTSTSSAAEAMDQTAADTYYGATFGLGVAQGDNFVVKFTNPVTAETKWKSALKISLTYI